MMVVSLAMYKDLRGVTLNKALEECKEAEALTFDGTKILVDVEKINEYLEVEAIEGLKNLKSLEVRV
jgi:hypothetical protein